MDTITPEARSALMARIRHRDTKPERVVRSLLHRMGYRFRLCRKDLPGRPDIALPRHKKIVLVHGCFWHGHDCRLASKPKSNAEYWLGKIATNRARDAKNLSALNEIGWDVLELWECEIRNFVNIESRLLRFLNNEAIANPARTDTT
jgi:DNA mismatch endonuclease (patch repair protein)